MKHTYVVTGMHCKSCVQKLEQALTGVPSITSVTVSLVPPEATIEMASHVLIEVLNEAAKRAGNYSLTEKVIVATFAGATSSESEPAQSLTPLFVIVGYITGGVLLRSIISEDFTLHTLMGNFMGGFFVVFSLFKMINLSGFADGYSTYDVIARRSRAYALLYPFIELALGILYFTSLAPVFTNVATFILMGIGSIGVAQALMRKQVIQCACLGTALKLPMTKVTLAEDVVMGLMALLMFVS